MYDKFDEYNGLPLTNGEVRLANEMEIEHLYTGPQVFVRKRSAIRVELHTTTSQLTAVQFWNMPLSPAYLNTLQERCCPTVENHLDCAIAANKKYYGPGAGVLAQKTRPEVQNYEVTGLGLFSAF